MNAGRAKTTLDYILVTEATKLTLNIERYDRMRSSIFTNQKRHALVMLLRKTHEAAAMEGAEAALRVSAHLDANKYFSDSTFKARADRAFEAAGYAPAALEGEAFVLALRDLAVVDKLIASAQKRLIAILKELEERYASQDSKKKMNNPESKARARTK